MAYCFCDFCDRIFTKGSEDTVLTEKKAFNIGLFQCIAMIPGVSRSMATIVGGMAQKLTRKEAAEFSFFLAVPTMFAATGYKVLKLFLDGGTEVLMNNMPALIIGNVVAFIVALLAIKFFINFVTKYGFKAFGWSRLMLSDCASAYSRYWNFYIVQISNLDTFRMNNSFIIKISSWIIYNLSINHM